MNSTVRISKQQQLLNIESTARYIHVNQDENTDYQQLRLNQYKLEALESGISASEVFDAIAKGRQS